MIPAKVYGLETENYYTSNSSEFQVIINCTELILGKNKMSDSYTKYKEDCEEYEYLCKLLNENEQRDMYDHFAKLKKDPRIIWKDYRYQLKDK
jgi:hypothetical protein